MATDISTIAQPTRFAQAIKLGPSSAQVGVLLTLASAVTLAAGSFILGAAAKLRATR